jgi:hypothetical protein
MTLVGGGCNACMHACKCKASVSLQGVMRKMQRTRPAHICSAACLAHAYVLVNGDGM